MRFYEAIPAFINEMRYGRNCSKQTLRAYESDLRQFTTFIAEYLSRPLDEVDVEEPDHRAVRAWLSSLALAGAAKSSRSRKLSSLRSFYDYLLRRGAVGRNPARIVNAPKKEDRSPAFLTRGEAATLLDEPFDPGPLGARNRALLELLYAAGIRVGELVSIDLGDFDLESGGLRVTGKGSKMREVVFGDHAREAIEDYLRLRPALKPEPDQKALFLNHRGGRLTDRSVARILKARIRDIGLKRGISPHALRHTFATHMLNAGADIRSLQELLGHASLSTTQRYTRVGVEELMATYLKCHPRAK